LGEQGDAVELVPAVIECVEDMLNPHEHVVSYLVETRSRIVVEVIALGSL